MEKNIGISRVEPLDYLRGIMAFSVLIYHYVTWLNLELIYPFNNLIDILGIYAVSAFYVLSGTSLAIGYAKRDLNTNFLKNFAIKRVFRIVPLFYLATILTVILVILTAYRNGDFSSTPNLDEYLLNFSLLFSWLSPTSYIATGAWSIGNELVFYSIFPLMLYLINKSLRSFVVFFAITVLVSGYFSEVLLNTDAGLVSQWGLYINPLNLLYFFTGGVLIGLLLKSGKVINQKLVAILLIVSVGVLFFAPLSGGDHINIVVGYSKLILSLAIFALVIVAAFSGNVKQSLLTKTLKYLGDTSYSIYLLHPIVFTVCSTILSQVSPLNNEIIIFTVSVIGSLIASHLSYTFIEKPMMNRGKKVATKKAFKKVLSVT